MTIKKTQKGMFISSSKADVALTGIPLRIIRKNNEEDSSGEEVAITSPGEYEIQGVSVSADFLDLNDLQSPLLYLIEVENFTIGYLPLPDLDEKTDQHLSDDVKSRFDNIDILMIPGAWYQIANQLPPSLAIPTNDIELFTQKLNSTLPEKRGSFTIKKLSDLPENMEIINLGS
ncbi:hypothetical protein HGA91_02630 [candidate division WWE3 bacterium]|nr:hypothetical protein [candidate division WWE3 bacterium]